MKRVAVVLLAFISVLPTPVFAQSNPVVQKALAQLALKPFGAFFNPPYKLLGSTTTNKVTTFFTSDNANHWHSWVCTEVDGGGAICQLAGVIEVGFAIPP